MAGHTGDAATARAGLRADDATVRATALSALDRLGALGDDELATAVGDPSTEVRRRAAQLAARRPDLDLRPLLDDADAGVVEMAAWAAGEHESAHPDVLDRLCRLARNAEDALVREAAVAALGAIGAERGRQSVLAALADKPAIRRRAVLALAPFTGDDIDAALEQALTDRDWQVRQAAEDLHRAMR